LLCFKSFYITAKNKYTYVDLIGIRKFELSAQKDQLIDKNRGGGVKEREGERERGKERY